MNITTNKKAAHTIIKALYPEGLPVSYYEVFDIDGKRCGDAGTYKAAYDLLCAVNEKAGHSGARIERVRLKPSGLLRRAKKFIVCRGSEVDLDECEFRSENGWISSIEDAKTYKQYSVARGVAQRYAINNRGTAFSVRTVYKFEDPESDKVGWE